MVCTLPRIAILQDLERLSVFLGQDVVHGRDMLPELGVDAAMRGTDFEQAVRRPEVDLLLNGFVFFRPSLQISQAAYFFGAHSFVRCVADSTTRFKPSKVGEDNAVGNTADGRRVEKAVILNLKKQ